MNENDAPLLPVLPFAPSVRVLGVAAVGVVDDDGTGRGRTAVNNGGLLSRPDVTPGWLG